MTTKKKKLKKYLFATIAFFLVGLICFAVVEIALMVFMKQMTGPVQFSHNKDLGAIPVPNQKATRTRPRIYEYRYSNDSNGRRVTGFVDEKKAKKRILFLGDSFTYGIGVSDRETFAYLVEKALATKVINGGNGGKGTDYALKFFQLYGKKLCPDLTILCFFSNDFADNGYNKYFSIKDDKLSYKAIPKPGKLRQFLRKSTFYNWIITWSHTANWVKSKLVMQIIKRERSQNPANKNVIAHQKKQGTYCNQKNVSLTKIFLQKLHQEVLNSKSKYMVFYIPNNLEVENYRTSGKISIEEKTCRKAVGNKLLSLTPILAKNKASISKLYYPNEGHWTALAHKIAAKFMSQHIKSAFGK